MSILENLVNKKIINKGDVIKIEKQSIDSGKSVEEILEEMGVPVQTILDIKSEYYGVPSINLENYLIPFSVLEQFSEDAILRYKFVPLAINDGVFEVGMVDPDNIESRDALTFIVGKLNLPYKIFVIVEKDLKKVIDSYKGLTGEVNKALTEIEPNTEQNLKDDIEIIQDEDSSYGKIEAKIIEASPIIKIVDTIIRYAVEGEASDVHIEPMRDKARVRYRVDGVLNNSITIPSSNLPAVIARIKIMSKMKLDEKRKPQDGRFSAIIDKRRIDLRVSTFPSYYGEKVVMRILDQEKGVQQLDQMMISPRYLGMIREAMARPYGLILISGPTGSGKTTTLYSMLNEIDKNEKNVLSLEDPIEYNIDGMSQSQVFPEIGYDFVNGLRTTLRQDPDVIMVGEIRDKETAQLAVQAALTGHLVLSTIHTNTACGVVPRLIDMGVDPYLISPVLILTMAQRLVSQICPGTGKPMPIEGSLKTMIDKQFADLPDQYRSEIPKVKEILEAVSTPKCPKGIKGRVAIFEMFKMSPEIEQVILKNPIESEVYKIARKNGLVTMKEDAIIKAMQKIIPFEEINQL